MLFRLLEDYYFKAHAQRISIQFHRNIDNFVVDRKTKL